MIPEGSAGISVQIVLFFSNPIDPVVATGAVVATAAVVSGGATIAATVVVTDGPVFAATIVVANVRKPLLKILFRVFKSSSSSASGNLCSAAITAAVFVTATADVKRISNSFSVFLSIQLTISLIASLFIALSFTNTH